jgi:hypothetical protein
VISYGQTQPLKKVEVQASEELPWDSGLTSLKNSYRLTTSVFSNLSRPLNQIT